MTRPEDPIDAMRVRIAELEAKAESDLKTIQRESANVNEMGGVIAFLSGALVAIMRRTETIDEAKTLATMAVENVTEWNAGTWKPGPPDEIGEWRPRHMR